MYALIPQFSLCDIRCLFALTARSPAYPALLYLTTVSFVTRLPWRCRACCLTVVGRAMMANNPATTDDTSRCTPHLGTPPTQAGGGCDPLQTSMTSTAVLGSGPQYGFSKPIGFVKAGSERDDHDGHGGNADAKPSATNDNDGHGDNGNDGDSIIQIAIIQ
ncbi:hypothetical protein BJY52DRAFT_1228956 [Lactarius psammicola]|nr:hypothetical protein BJY52DRAFT_1228956 [Lactarius psammicola]